ncbi:MAG: GTPase [Burkholderiales bacterium]|nr:GTPase [Burkholderiales bacterium]
MESAANKQSRVQLLAGGIYQTREAWIDTAIAALPSGVKVGVLLEGLPTGSPLLHTSSTLLVERIAPGCFCCIGQLAMTVSLHRLLRRQLDYLFIAINDISHAHALYLHLQSEPYSQRLKCENMMTL